MVHMTEQMTDRTASMFSALCKCLGLAVLSVLMSVPQAVAAEMETSPIYFTAVLSADEESAPTYSDGSGRVDFVLDRATLEFSWTATWKGLTSPITGMHVHGPQR